MLKVLTENKFHVPVSISLDSASSVSKASPKVRVRVSDLLGNSLGKMDVVVESAMRQSDGAVILANSKMADAGNGIYEIDMLAAKPGSYSLSYFNFVSCRLKGISCVENLDIGLISPIFQLVLSSIVSTPLSFLTCNESSFGLRQFG